MKKYLKQVIALFVVTALVTVTGFTTVYAKTDSGAPASSLTVSFTSEGKTELLHEYTIEEISSLIDGKEVRYSSIDAMPARVLTVGSGVYIDTLVLDLAKYTDVDVENFQRIKLTATDGWTRTYLKSDLYAQKYYYKNLFNKDVWDSASGRAEAAAAADAVIVKPMLAVTSWQGRIMEGTGDVSALVGELSSEMTFRLCLGMDPSDLTSGDSTTSEYGRWIDRIELILTDETMTRAMFVTVLGRLAEADTANYSNDFQDVARGQYFEGYVAWASGNGFVSGSGNGMFLPDDRITREQIALILYRYAKLTGIDISDTDQAQCRSYSDYGSVTDAAKEAFCWVVNQGIMAGSGGKLEPKGEATRAQVTQIMKNFAEAGGLL